MAKSEASVEELVSMIQRGELRLPEMQRRWVWRATRVRDLLDSLYRGYPSGAILLWETDEEVPLQEFAVGQEESPYTSTRLLLDGQQRLTSLSAVIRGEPISVRARKTPIELLFNLDHPEKLSVVTEVNEDTDDDELIEDETDSTEDELQRRAREGWATERRDELHYRETLAAAWFRRFASSTSGGDPFGGCEDDAPPSWLRRRRWRSRVSRSGSSPSCVSSSRRNSSYRSMTDSRRPRAASARMASRCAGSA